MSKAKPKLRDLVEQARKGQVHVIAVHDQPVVELGPAKAQAGVLTKEWRERRKKIFLNAESQKRLTIGGDECGPIASME